MAQRFSMSLAEGMRKAGLAAIPIASKPALTEDASVPSRGLDFRGSKQPVISLAF